MPSHDNVIEGTVSELGSCSASRITLLTTGSTQSDVDIDAQEQRHTA